MRVTENHLRGLSIIAGTILAVMVLTTGVDGFTKTLAGVLVGFGVGKGVTKAQTTKLIRRLKDYG